MKAFMIAVLNGFFWSLCAVHAGEKNACTPPARFVKETLHNGSFAGLDAKLFKGEINGVSGQWTIVYVDHKFKVPHTETPSERNALVQKLKNQRMATDLLVGRDAHTIYDLDLFKNGIETYGSYLDNDAESHYYLNWEFGLKESTCILEFEASEMILPSPGDKKDLRRYLTDAN